MSEERLNDELAAIEAALCSLTPAASGIERDRLMFLAGKASASRGSSRRRVTTTFWPLATAMSLLGAMTFGILWAADSGSQVSQRPASPLYANAPPALDLSGAEAPPSPWENRHLCLLLLEKGIDALPESRVYGVSGERPAPREDGYRGLLRQLLDNPAG
jgi:hypothetical protein